MASHGSRRAGGPSVDGDRHSWHQGAGMDCRSWPNGAPEAHVLEGVDVVSRAMDAYPDGQLAMAFNGGKDCTAMLGLVMLAHAKRLGRGPASRGRVCH